VRQVELHGVKISYYRKGASEGQESSVSSRQAVPPSHTTPHDPSSDPPLNSRQRRSRERARKYFASWAAANPQEQPAAPMHLEQAPVASGTDAMSSLLSSGGTASGSAGSEAAAATSTAAQEVAARNARALALFKARRDGVLSGKGNDGCGRDSGARRGGGPNDQSRDPGGSS
jgi:hypothetical protein